MKTVAVQLAEARSSLVRDLAELLKKHSSLYDLNEGSRDLLIVGPSYCWKDLSVEGARLQSRLLQEFNHFHTLVMVLLGKQSGEVRQRIEQGGEEIRSSIEQTDNSWDSSTDRALSAASQALDQMMNAINQLYDPTEGSVLLVPDTNSLLHNPDLENWSFPEFKKIELVLVPTVLGELDALKINHRNEQVRQKAEGLIRRFKEYRRRGSLTKGVPLSPAVSSIRAVAREPRIQESLPWLDAENADDRFVATVIEVMRLHPRCAVVLVTRDINLQNKAEFARLPFVEPPKPTCE